MTRVRLSGRRSVVGVQQFGLETFMRLLRERLQRAFGIEVTAEEAEAFTGFIRARRPSWRSRSERKGRRPLSRRPTEAQYFSRLELSTTGPPEPTPRRRLLDGPR